MANYDNRTVLSLISRLFLVRLLLLAVCPGERVRGVTTRLHSQKPGQTESESPRLFFVSGANA